MKKLLVGTAAIALGLSLSAPAKAADGVKLGIGGYFKGYTAWMDQDEDDDATTEARNFDILRDTEVHFTGETTLDNGLTVGFHTELEDDMDDSFNVNESYAYFSGAWGRVNFGGEDGAAYLLQVSAPSADSNYDGLRQYINPVNYGIAPNGDFGNGADDTFDFTGLVGVQQDYAQDVSGNFDKFTYLSPVFSGFQAGVSYTPDVGAGAVSRQFGVTTDNVEDALGNGWDLAARWEGNVGEAGVTLGAGFSDVDVERDTNDSSQDRQVWNLGADVNWGAFGLGAAYKTDDNAIEDDGDTDIWVVGVDYTTGPYKLGASYMNRNDEPVFYGGAAGDDELDTDRWSGGVVYTYGPGMTFRGSLNWINHEVDDAEFDSTSALLGTQIDF